MVCLNQRKKRPRRLHSQQRKKEQLRHGRGEAGESNMFEGSTKAGLSDRALTEKFGGKGGVNNRPTWGWGDEGRPIKASPVVGKTLVEKVK